MKTKNNVQKTILKSLAVVTSLVLLSITVNAQAFWKTVLENNSLNHIAMALVETKAPAKATSSAPANSFSESLLAEYATLESESPLNLEDWMISGNKFDANTFAFETETEFALELESWMIEENFGKKEKSTLKIPEEAFQLEKDNELQLESWMVHSSLWK